MSHKKNIIILLMPLLYGHIIFYFLFRKRLKINLDWGANSFYNFLYRIVFDKPYRNIFYHRLGKYKYLLSWILPSDKTTHVNKTMKIGYGIRLVHAHNTYLNAQSIGNNFTCYHNVTIGVKNKKIPTIGNNVTVSCGAVILGGISVGNNVIVGSNCVVVHDIPDNCTVIGNPSIIIKNNISY